MYGGGRLKKILIGTTNPSKVRRFEKLLEDYDVEFCTLKDLASPKNQRSRAPRRRKTLAHYLDGVAVYHHGKISSFMENSEAIRQGAFYMVDKPASERHEGWPLDSISLNRNTLTYFVHAGNNIYDAQEENIVLGEYRKRVVHFLAQALEL